MKVLIVSDTHGRDLNLIKVVERVSPIDLMIHLGDFESDEEYIKAIPDCHTEMVSGNNDFFDQLPKEKTLRIGKYNILITHGHRYGVNYSTNRLIETAKGNNIHIVMYGHTHIPLVELRDHIWMVNPGSLSLPRQYGRKPSFIIMDIDSKGEVHFTINYLID